MISSSLYIVCMPTSIYGVQGVDDGRPLRWNAPLPDRLHIVSNKEIVKQIYNAILSQEGIGGSEMNSSYSSSIDDKYRLLTFD